MQISPASTLSGQLRDELNFTVVNVAKGYCSLQSLTHNGN